MFWRTLVLAAFMAAAGSVFAWAAPKTTTDGGSPGPCTVCDCCKFGTGNCTGKPSASSCQAACADCLIRQQTPTEMSPAPTSNPVPAKPGGAAPVSPKSK
jgi:hypothetical protein